jgi:hypothetical protein
MHVHIVHEGLGERTIVRIGFPLNPKMRKLATACMTFIVPDETQEPIGLQWVGFESKCATPDIPEDGGGVAMTRAAIEYILERFPERDRIQFTDDSKLKRCKAGLLPRRSLSSAATTNFQNIRDVVVHLAYHNLMLYGATWYQRHFGAEITALDESAKIQQQQMLQHVRDHLDIQTPRGKGAFDAWMAKFVLPATISPSLAWMRGHEITSEMRAAYEESGSWFDFYRNVNARCGCGVFAILIETVLRNPPSVGGMGLNMATWTWEIRRKTVGGSSSGRKRGGHMSLRKAATEGKAASARAYFCRLDKSNFKNKFRDGGLEFA